jgi:hypothetical protein
VNFSPPLGPKKLISEQEDIKIKKNAFSTLKGHSHEKVFEIIPLNDRFGPNSGMPTLL